jgi:hypothetical protein
MDRPTAMAHPHPTRHAARLDLGTKPGAYSGGNGAVAVLGPCRHAYPALSPRGLIPKRTIMR